MEEADVLAVEVDVDEVAYFAFLIDQSLAYARIVPVKDFQEFADIGGVGLDLVLSVGNPAQGSGDVHLDRHYVKALLMAVPSLAI